MNTINRTVAIVKPKQPYVVLLPDVADDAAVEAAVRAIAEELFAVELAAWDTDQDAWPQQRGYAALV